MAGLFRPIKYAIKGYDFYRTLVLEATENDDNGPYPSQMDFIVKRSRDFPEAPAVMMEIIRERLEDRGKKWRRPLKALILLEHCIREGPDEFLELGASSVRAIRDLREIQFVIKDGTDPAAAVRDKAKEMVSWIQEQSQVRQERIRHEELEEELRKEDLRQQRLQQAMKLRQGREIGPSDDLEPPSYSKVVKLDSELQSEEMRQERLRLAAQIRAEKSPSTEVELDGSPPGPSDHGIANDTSTGGKV